MLTYHSIIVVILHTHLDVLYTEIHFHRLHIQVCPVVVLLLVRLCFEVHLAFYILIITPIVAGAARFN